MANLDRQLYIIINTVNGYIEPGIQNTSIPKLYSLAGARRSLSHKKRWAEEQAKEKGESIVTENAHRDTPIDSPFSHISTVKHVGEGNGHVAWIPGTALHTHLNRPKKDGKNKHF